MKHIILKLSLLFLTLGVLTSSREDADRGNKTVSAIAREGCLHSKNDYAVNLTCKKEIVSPQKKEIVPVAPSADNEAPLSPISRFILLQ